MVYNILVIDDSQDDIFFFKKALDKAGIQSFLTCLSDGAIGLETIRKESFDCVFLDYYMPGLDGYTILRKVREEGIDTSVVMLTGQDDEQTIVKLMQMGATDYLSKSSLTPESLRLSIENAHKVYLMRKEKAKAEAALKISEGRLAEAQRIANIGNWEQGFSDHSFFLSEEARRIIGNDGGSSKINLLRFCRKIHRKDFPMFKRTLDHLRRSQSYDMNIRYYETPEHMKCLNIKGYLVNGNKAVGTVQDITLLKNALLETQKANIRRKATSIVLVIAVVCFLLSEAILDPFVDSFTASAGLLISLSCKGSIAVALKPIEILLKKIMMSRVAIT